MAGDLYRLRRLRHVHEDGAGWSTYGPSKRDRVAVVMLLGYEPKKVDGLAQKLDVEEAMNELGWYRLGPDGEPIVVGRKHLAPDFRSLMEVWQDLSIEENARQRVAESILIPD